MNPNENLFESEILTQKGDAHDCMGASFINTCVSPEGFCDIGNSFGISYITKNTRLTGADALLFIYYAMSLTALVKREIFLPTVFL